MGPGFSYFVRGRLFCPGKTFFVRGKLFLFGKDYLLFVEAYLLLSGKTILRQLSPDIREHFIGSVDSQINDIISVKGK